VTGKLVARHGAALSARLGDARAAGPVSTARLTLVNVVDVFELPEQDRWHEAGGSARRREKVAWTWLDKT
jgi:hypothetical protein